MLVRLIVVSLNIRGNKVRRATESITQKAGPVFASYAEGVAPLQPRVARFGATLGTGKDRGLKPIRG